ncbi:MAG TPA: glycosyltransferase, partial [Bacteroidia bacterium]|nr:glycosyltransferase [Bacteroidia bacterium]
MSPEEYPSVSIVISAFNEERVIAEKIEGILQSNYPKEKLEILIGSDASVDQTADIIQTFVKKEERIHFYNFKERRGKPSVI